MKKLYVSAPKWTPLLLLSLVVSACGGGGGGGDTATTADTRTIPDTAPASTSSATLSGRAVDGYLRYAKVWLDLNDNYIADPNEPTTTTGKGGDYTFSATDLTGIDHPEQYPIMVQALAGTTVDEDLIVKSNEATGYVQLPFVLMAPPGATLVTPLTTLVKLEMDAMKRDSSLSSESITAQSAQTRLQALLGKNINFMQNFVAAKDAEAYAYARAVVNTVQLNLLNINDTDANAALASLSSDKLQLLGRALLANAPEIVQKVDAALGTSPNFDSIRTNQFVTGISITNLLYAMNDTPVLYNTHWYIQKDSTSSSDSTQLADINWTSDQLPLENLREIAQITRSYNTLGKNTSISVDGQPGVSFHASSFEGASLSTSFPKSNAAYEAIDGIADFVVTNNFSAGRLVSSQFVLNQPDRASDDLKAKAAAATTFGYNDDGILAEIDSPIVSGQQTWSFTYDGNNYLTNLQVLSTQDSGKQFAITDFEYDANMRLAATHVTTGFGIPVDAYSPTARSGLIITGPIQSYVSGGSITTYTYNDSGTLASACTRDGDINKTDSCWYFDYSGFGSGSGSVTRYMETVNNGQPFLGRDGGGHIVAIAVDEYRPLSQIAQ